MLTLNTGNTVRSGSLDTRDKISSNEFAEIWNVEMVECFMPVHNIPVSSVDGSEDCVVVVVLIKIHVAKSMQNHSVIRELWC